MATPTRRERLGITPEMIDAFGPIIFDLSTNIQDRSGDPVRLLDFEEIERQRTGAGLADAEIAARLGLAADQVTFIRVLLEQRRFKPERYYRLFQLGGGRRFRTERGMEHDPFEEVQFSPDAMAVRDAMRFRPDHVRREVEAGRWPADTTATWLRHWARETPEATAIAAPGHSPITYAAALDRAESLAAALAGLGLRRGDVISVQLPSTPEFVIVYYAVARLGRRPLHAAHALRRRRSRAYLAARAGAGRVLRRGYRKIRSARHVHDTGAAPAESTAHHFHRATARLRVVA